jgi:hypothetical protein
MLFHPKNFYYMVNFGPIRIGTIFLRDPALLFDQTLIKHQAKLGADFE